MERIGSNGLISKIVYRVNKMSFKTRLHKFDKWTIKMGIKDKNILGSNITYKRHECKIVGYSNCEELDVICVWIMPMKSDSDIGMGCGNTQSIYF